MSSTYISWLPIVCQMAKTSEVGPWPKEAWSPCSRCGRKHGHPVLVVDGSYLARNHRVEIVSQLERVRRENSRKFAATMYLEGERRDSLLYTRIASQTSSIIVGIWVWCKAVAMLLCRLRKRLAARTKMRSRGVRFWWLALMRRK